MRERATHIKARLDYKCVLEWHFLQDEAQSSYSLSLSDFEANGKIFPEPRRIENSFRPLLSRQTPSEKVREKG